ncbi:DUF2231 domain-containing protein [Streptomyces sp. NPDC007264]|uniref:DUF2231 domain-containing protein n=1 Tax=Streptomyces sp. NPDC007264 TaxID=3364777 RepID=UPI0036DA51E0
MSVGLINGLPGHPLFVHGSVVLVPLTALALVVCAVWPATARRFGWLLPVLGLVALALVVLTTESGEWLEERVKETPLVESHAEMGEGLTPWVIALLVLTAVVWWLGRAARRRPYGEDVVDGPTGGRAPAGARLAGSVPLRVVVLVLALAVGVGAVVQAYRIGDSGAKAVWKGRFSTGEPTEKD